MKLRMLCIFFLPLCVIGQVEETPEAMLHWRFIEDINLYSMPDGNVLESLQNDFENEDYLSLKILAETEDFFFTEMQYSRSGTTHQGWVKKSKHIGAFSRNESDVQNLNLYTEPNYSDSEQIHLREWKSTFITIEKCDGEWRFVSLIYRGKKVTGWIEASKLCDNNNLNCGW